MRTNFILSIIISVITGFSILFRHSLMSGMSPFLGYFVNGFLIVLLIVTAALFLFQKVKKYKLIQLAIALLCIFIGVFSQVYFEDFLSS